MIYRFCNFRCHLELFLVSFGFRYGCYDVCYIRFYFLITFQFEPHVVSYLKRNTEKYLRECIATITIRINLELSSTLVSPSLAIVTATIVRSFFKCSWSLHVTPQRSQYEIQLKYTSKQIGRKSQFLFRQFAIYQYKIQL